MHRLPTRIIPAILLLTATTAFAAPKIDRIDPPCWWTGMANDTLQLMVTGHDIRDCDVKTDRTDVKITEIGRLDSKNYMFVNLVIGRDASAGDISLTFSDKRGETTMKYPLLARNKSDNRAQGFDASDVLYLIMPDRFADGNPKNNGKFDRNDPDARHGGDIQGIIDHLDYIAELGATAIWCTPLLLDNQGHESYHGYACADYYHIDPRFGDNDLYKSFVDAAHQHGIKVIMDIVTNHCGTAHWWMEEAPFADWYHSAEPYTQMNALFSVYMDPNASVRDRERQESGWFVPSMPDMNLDNPYVLKYFQQWAVWWVEYAGLDGLRVDTYPYNEPVPMS
ncbi:MAG: cyclomaltodextrinase N-terminal domain-containing protein, partial [Muribaculaceae bacterium]|nr:cyclomaltodextrinase N-terminal domain-containing protein [Muribaculaceae bacterium]